MTAQTLTLTDFLLARIAEDEEVARTLESAAWWVDGEHVIQTTAGYKYPSFGFSSGASIVPDESAKARLWRPDGERWARMVSCAHEHRTRGRDVNHCPMTHVVRHDPARVLAECDTKRRIVEALIDMEPVEEERKEQVVTLRWACEMLAHPYADHPDYNPDWRP